MAIDENLIREFISQPGITDAQIAAAMQQYNVTPEQVAAAVNAPLADVQARYDAAVAQQQSSAPASGLSVLQTPTYGTSNLPGNVISNFISTNIENPELIAQKAREFGLSAKDIQGAAGYTPEQQARYLSFAGLSPEGISGLTPLTYGKDDEFTAKDVLGYLTTNIEDPTRIYQAAQEYEITPEQIYDLMQEKAIPQLDSLSKIQSFFEQGKTEFADRYNQIIDQTFGNDEEVSRIEQILGLKAGDLEKIYDPSQFSQSSIEKIEETLQSSRINKIQDALITKAIAKDLLGYGDDEITTMVSDLVQGQEDDPILKDIFESLKSGNRMTKDEFEEVMKTAARDNPDAALFERQPDLKVKYSPIEATEGVSGQYGYYNNAPILLGSALDRYLKDSNQVKADLGEGDLGWATNSKYAGEIRNGAAVFGVKATKEQLNEFDKIEKEIQRAGGLQTIDGVQGIYRTDTDPETGQTYQRFVPVNQLGSYDPESGRNVTQEYQDTRQQLETAAQKLNIDPKQYSTTKELFDAVQDKSKDLYLVVGRARDWDPDIAKAAGITVTDGSRGGVNHAAVLYQRFGDKAIAVQAPQTFGFDDPKTPRWYQEIASIPFIAEAIAMIPGMQQFYPIIKGIQAAALGADEGDILKNVVLSYVGQNVIPQISPEITASIGNTLLESGINPEIASTLANAGAQVALNTGMSVLAGADIGEAAERSLLNYGVSRGVSGGLSLADFPTEFRPDVARLLTEGIISGNFENAAKNAVLRYGQGQLKNIVQNTSRTPTTTGPVLQAARGGLAQASRMPRMARRVAPIRRDVRKLIPLRRSGLAYIGT